MTEPLSVEFLKLGSLISNNFQNGLYKPSSEYGNGTRIVRINDYCNDGVLNIEQLKRVMLSDKEANSFSLEVGDIVINRVNSLSHIGKCCLIDAVDGWLVFESNMMRLRISSDDLVFPEYVVCVMRTTRARDYLRKVAKPAIAQASINQDDVKSLKIPFLTKPEQHKVVAVLSTWDRAIKRTKALIAAKERRKKWLMQQLLTGRVRFEEFVKSAGKRKTSYYDLPEDWGYPSIGEVAKQVSVKNISGAALPVLSCTKHAGLVDSLAYFGKQIFSEDLSTYKVVPRGAFAYATNHIEEGSIGFQGLYKEAAISPMYTVFKTTKAVHDGFLFKLLKTEWYRHIFEVCTSASVDRRGSLRWKEFAKIRIPLPGMPEQEKISGVLDVADGEIQQLKTKLSTLKEQKKGLMQQLLTGKVRVKIY